MIDNHGDPIENLKDQSEVSESDQILGEFNKYNNMLENNNFRRWPKDKLLSMVNEMVFSYPDICKLPDEAFMVEENSDNFHQNPIMKMNPLVWGPVKRTTDIEWPNPPAEFKRRVVGTDPDQIFGNSMLEEFFADFDGLIFYQDDLSTVYVLIIGIGYIHRLTLKYLEAFHPCPVEMDILLLTPPCILLNRYVLLSENIFAKIVKYYPLLSKTKPFSFKITFGQNILETTTIIRIWSAISKSFIRVNDHLTVGDMICNIENGRNPDCINGSSPYDMDFRSDRVVDRISMVEEYAEVERKQLVHHLDMMYRESNITRVEIENNNTTEEEIRLTKVESKKG